MHQNILAPLGGIIKPLGALAVLTAFILLQAGAFSGAAGAAEVIVKETSRVTASDPVSSSDLVEPTAPFAGGKEHKAAGTMVTGENPGVPSLDVVNYAVAVGERTNTDLTLNATLSRMEDRATLDRLANKIYSDNRGMHYENVVINWHLGTNPEVPEPFARTTLSKAGLVGFVYLQPVSTTPVVLPLN